MNEADVIVVGGGGSGLAAASEAARLGRRVILLEKNPHTGGTTSWSVGSITVTNSPHQRRHGIQDSPDEHFEDLGKHAGALAPRDNLVLRRLLVENTSDMLEWLQRLGVVFVGPMPEPPHRYRRMHTVVPNSKSFAYHLTRHCRRLGVDIRVNARATRLIVERGRVAGAEAMVDGRPTAFRARSAVVLASGDYSGDRELKAKYAAPEVVDVEPVNPSSTGDGHKLALEVGARIVNGDLVRGPIMRFVPPTRPNLIGRLPPWRWLALSAAWSFEHLPRRIVRPFLMSFLTTALGPSAELFKEGAVLVNRDGERFTDELSAPAFSVPAQADRVAYILFDHRLARRFRRWPHFVSTAPGVAYAYLADYRRNRADIYHQAPSIAGLAQSLGIQPEKLADTVARHNATEREMRPALTQSPFYALGPVKSYCVFADGGLAVNERLEVLKDGGDPIPGLFAAGSTGQGGVLLEGHGHHLGWAFISGRIAGRNAAFAGRSIPAG